MDILGLARKNAELAIAYRRHLHRNPELSAVEYKTLEWIKNRLEEFHIRYEEVEDGGLLGYIGREEAGKTVLLRADIDALPIQENKRNLTRERSVISERYGVQHACGHDAHTAMLLIAGKILKENEKELNGRVILLFERGEEGGGNLRQVLKYIEARRIRIDGAHAIHVRPGVAAGRIVARGGPCMAGGSGFSVNISGKDGHGSRPDLANHPMACFVAVYNALSGIRLKHVSPFDTLAFSVGQVESGIKGNIIPRDLTFKGSARFYNPEVGTKFVEEFQTILENITAAYHCTYEIQSLFKGFPVVNNGKISELSQRSVRKYVGEDTLVTDGEPLMSSESFSMIAKLYPSIMVHLGIDNAGIGSGADLHTEYFDIDERVLPLGIAETVGFALEFLNNKEEIPFDPYPGTVSELIDSRLAGVRPT